MNIKIFKKNSFENQNDENRYDSNTINSNSSNRNKEKGKENLNVQQSIIDNSDSTKLNSKLTEMKETETLTNFKSSKQYNKSQINNNGSNSFSSITISKNNHNDNNIMNKLKEKFTFDDSKNNSKEQGIIVIDDEKFKEELIILDNDYIHEINEVDKNLLNNKKLDVEEKGNNNSISINDNDNFNIIDDIFDSTLLEENINLNKTQGLSKNMGSELIDLNEIMKDSITMPFTVDDKSEKRPPLTNPSKSFINNNNYSNNNNNSNNDNDNKNNNNSKNNNSNKNNNGNNNEKIPLKDFNLNNNNEQNMNPNSIINSNSVSDKSINNNSDMMTSDHLQKNVNYIIIDDDDDDDNVNDNEMPILASFNKAAKDKKDDEIFNKLISKISQNNSNKNNNNQDHNSISVLDKNKNDQKKEIDSDLDLDISSDFESFIDKVTNEHSLNQNKTIKNSNPFAMSKEDKEKDVNFNGKSILEGIFSPKEKETTKISYGELEEDKIVFSNTSNTYNFQWDTKDSIVSSGDEPFSQKNNNIIRSSNKKKSNNKGKGKEIYIDDDISQDDSVITSPIDPDILQQINKINSANPSTSTTNRFNDPLSLFNPNYLALNNKNISKTNNNQTNSNKNRNHVPVSEIPFQMNIMNIKSNSNLNKTNNTLTNNVKSSTTEYDFTNNNKLYNMNSTSSKSYIRPNSKSKLKLNKYSNDTLDESIVYSPDPGDDDIFIIDNKNSHKRKLGNGHMSSLTLTKKLKSNSDSSTNNSFKSNISDSSNNTSLKNNINKPSNTNPPQNRMGSTTSNSLSKTNSLSSLSEIKTCPLCNKTLENTSPDEINNHINACALEAFNMNDI